MSRNALRASCQRSAFSIQLLNSAANQHVRAKPSRGMKSPRRAKNMEDSNTVRCAQAHSSQLSALESAPMRLISVAFSAVLTMPQTGMSELRHEIGAASKEYGG